LVNYPTVCTNTPSFTVKIGACVLVSYTVAVYPDFNYNLGSGTQTTPYPVSIWWVVALCPRFSAMTLLIIYSALTIQIWIMLPTHTLSFLLAPYLLFLL